MQQTTNDVNAKVGDMLRMVSSRASWYGLVLEINEQNVATIWRPTESDLNRIQTWPLRSHYFIEVLR